MGGRDEAIEDMDGEAHSIRARKRKANRSPFVTELVLMFFLFGRPGRLEAFNDTSWPQEWLGDGSMSGLIVGRHLYFGSQFSDIDCADAWGVIFPVAAATV